MGFWWEFARGMSGIASAAKGGHIAAKAVPIIEEITGRACDDFGKEQLMKTSTSMGQYGFTKYDYAFNFLASFYVEKMSYSGKSHYPCDEELEKK